MSFLLAAGLVVLAYLVGSISPSLLLGRLVRGIDLRQHGSGNLGATNAYRVLGKGLGSAVLLADLLKGLLPVLLSRAVAGPWVTVLVALAAIAGHNYSLFLRGKGGKGAATGAGTVLAMVPLLMAVQVVVFLAVLAMSGFVSLASVTATVLLPFLMVTTGQPPAYVVFSFLGAGVVIWAHRGNLRRLAGGSERRVTFRWHRRTAPTGSSGGPAEEPSGGAPPAHEDTRRG